ncbi:MAG TPA: lasso peptide biosynthesis B2 protein [Nannocystis sp.]
MATMDDTNDEKRASGAPVSAASFAAFLLGRGDPPPEAVIRAARLEGYAYVALPPDHPMRVRFRADYLGALARHEAIKRDIAPLFRAWNDAGITPLLMKGFHMAEFVYPVPGMRFHGDVDVVLEPRYIRRAAAIAAELGWTGLPDPVDPPLPFRHEAYTLRRPAGHTQLDVQRCVVHRTLPLAWRQRRLTRAVLARAREIEWQGARVRVPHPVDAAAVCLLVHRAWGSEHWGLKTHDFLDLRFLVEREGVTRQALEARAAELGARRSLALMLERCDPWSGVFIPGPLPGRLAWRLDLRTLIEHAPHQVEKTAYRLLRAPLLLWDLGRTLPLVVRARNAARREPDMHRLLTQFTPSGDRSAPPRRITSRERIWLARGIKWGSQIIPARGVGRCVIRSLAHYHALRARGMDVQFVSGVKRDTDGIVGHAWVELDGHVLMELYEPDNPRIYKENFRYPPNA